MRCIEVLAKIDIPIQDNSVLKNDVTIKAGKKITVTQGKTEKYALWHESGIWDLPEEYVGETIRVISEQ